MYSVTDSSGNQAKKSFVLTVQAPPKPSEGNNNTVPQEPKKEPEKLNISDVINNHKTDKTKIGIDVSKWQQEVNWEQVKNAGVEFVMIRMGHQKDFDGELVLDPYFESNITGAKQVGLQVRSIFLLLCQKCGPSRRASKMGKRKFEGI